MAPKATEAYKVGDIYELGPGSLVLRPDGIVVTCGGDHALNLAGEYVFTDLKGETTTIAVEGPSADAEPDWTPKSTNAELLAAIEARNVERDPEGETYIVPEGETKAALIAALAADDEN